MTPSFKPGQGLPWHSRDESWQLLLAGKQRWLIAAPNNTAAQDAAAAAAESGGPSVYAHSSVWKEDSPLRAQDNGIRECVMEAGDVLYVPQGWWHSTRNEVTSEDSVGVAFAVGGQSHSPGLHMAAVMDDVEAADEVCKAHGYDSAHVCLKAPQLTQLGIMPVAHAAASAGSVRFLQWMHEHSFSDFASLDTMESSAAQKAAAAGKLDAVIWLHTTGKVDARRGYGPANSASMGRKTIHTASSYGHLAVVKWLIEHGGVSVHEPDGHGSQPIHVAVAGAQKQMVQWLLKKGARCCCRHQPCMIANTCFARCQSGC